MNLKNLVILLAACGQVLICECSSGFNKGRLRKFRTENRRSAAIQRVRRDWWTDFDRQFCPLDGHCWNKNTDSCDPCPPPPPQSSDCFPAAATVHLENEKTKTMAELRVGDKVKTVASDGTVSHSQVRIFMKSKLTVVTMYKSITTSDNNTISLTEDHLMFARKSSTGKFKIIYADDVSVDDVILVQGKDQMFPTKVISVFKLVMYVQLSNQYGQQESSILGAYTPVTMEGNIIFDGLLASCYAFPDHNLAHLGMTPMRWFPEIIKSIFGEENGSPGYVKVAEVVGEWLLPFDFLY